MRANEEVGLRLASWEAVVELARRRKEGPVRLDLPGGDLDYGAPVDVAIELPQGFVLTVFGEVRTVRPASIGGEMIARIELVGLTRARAAMLRALAYPPAHAWADGYALGRGTGRVSDLIRGNHALRRQLDGLTRSMRPRTERD